MAAAIASRDMLVKRSGLSLPAGRVPKQSLPTLFLRCDRCGEYYYNLQNGHKPSCSSLPLSRFSLPVLVVLVGPQVSVGFRSAGILFGPLPGCAIYCHPDDRCSGNGACAPDSAWSEQQNTRCRGVEGGPGSFGRDLRQTYVSRFGARKCTYLLAAALHPPP